MRNESINLKDLKQGDILLVDTNKHDIAHELIRILTDSQISHTAMVYYDTNQLIEETIPAIQLYDVKEKLKTGKIYVLRHNDQSLDMTKVLDIAKGYYDDKTPYPFSNLVVLGVYLVVSKYVLKAFPKPIQELLTRALYIGSAELMKLFNELQYKGKRPMVCSQLAYVCYKEAGPEYKLQIKRDSECDCLLNELKSWIEMRNDVNRIAEWNVDESFLAQYVDVSKAETEQLLQDICEEFAKSENDANNANGILSKDFVDAVVGFMKQFVITFGIKTKEELETMSVLDLIDVFMDLEEYFVSPGDLYKNCVNAKVIGELED